MKRLFIFLIFWFPAMVFAEWANVNGSVNTIYSHNGMIIIDTEITGGPCGDGKGFWWPITDDDSQIMFALVLTAQTTGKKINVVFDSSNPECSFSRAKITHMVLVNN